MTLLTAVSSLATSGGAQTLAVTNKAAAKEPDGMAYVSASAEPSAACRSNALAEVADRVAAAFDTHQFVFIGSTHGGEKSHDFLLCLLSRPAFQSRVTDVLVEWANPVHQTLVDRYLLKLDPVPRESLRAVWIDTDAPQLWGRLPLIPQFYDAVRSINERLAPARRIRVLGGCEPIDWSSVTSATDVASYPFKNNWAAHVIAKHFASDPERRLLVVYGDGHIHHNGGAMMGNLYATVDRAKLFVVGTIEALESDLVTQICFQRSGADHVARERSAGAVKDRAGVDQIRDALLLHEPPNRQDEGRPCLGDRKRKLVERQAVVDARDTLRGLAMGRG